MECCRCGTKSIISSPMCARTASKPTLSSWHQAPNKVVLATTILASLLATGLCEEWLDVS